MGRRSAIPQVAKRPGFELPLAATSVRRLLYFEYLDPHKRNELVPRLYESRKRILVTGGAGFLGSHLIDRLLKNGHEVLCIDNLFTGTKRNIEHLAGNTR